MHADKIAFAVLLLIALVFPAHAQNTQAAPTIRIYAASSLLNVLLDIAQTRQDEKIIIVPASSSALARQIDSGAPADIFIAAHPRWINWLAPRLDLKAQDAFPIARNRLALAAPCEKNREFQLSKSRKLSKIFNESRIALASPEAVPLGFYARQALSHFGLWESVRRNALFGSDARQPRIWLQRREVDLAVIYLSDLKNASALCLAALFPQESHQPIVYRALLLNKRALPALLFLQSPAVRSVFKQRGFLSP